MTLARASWIIIFLLCAITALMLAIGGYSGYSLTAVAVGLAAAVNLLPER